MKIDSMTKKKQKLLEEINKLLLFFVNHDEIILIEYRNQLKERRENEIKDFQDFIKTLQYDENNNYY